MTSRAATLCLLMSVLPVDRSAQAEGLSPDEKKLAEVVARQQPAALALLERVVNINSGTMNFAGVREVGEAFDAEFREIGFETRWIDGAPFSRAGHLVAHRAGTGRRFLLIGHLDTVFEADSPFQRFERLSETAARGPGIIDMKGGNVIIVAALKALESVGALRHADVTVVMTGDEEDMGGPPDIARRDLLDAARHADVVLAFENGSGDPARAVIARRGHTEWTLKVVAKPAHSSQIFQPETGAGAIFEIARVLTGFHERLSAEQPLTFSPGLILGGTEVTLDAPRSRGTAFGKTNVVAGDAAAIGDLRAISPEQLGAAKQAMQDVAAASLPHATSTLTFVDGYPPMAATPENQGLLALYDRVSRDLGTGPVGPTDPRQAGAADISFTARFAKMALDGIGLMGRDSHTSDETADLTTLLTQTQRAALLMLRLIHGG
jgi:glutamate carboxypeptidase